MLGLTATGLIAPGPIAMWSAAEFPSRIEGQLDSLLRLVPNGSLQGIAVDRLLAINLGIIVALFLLAHLLLIFPLFGRHGTPLVAKRWVAIESTGLALFVGILIWMTATSQRLWANNRFAGASPGARQVEVVGVQFHWYFRYPGSDATFGTVSPELVDAPGGNPLGLSPKDPAGKDDFISSDLVLPAGKEVDLRIRSQDVMHGFFIPGMRLKQDAVPGMVLHVHFTPERVGDYEILCSQLCGLGHARMQARLRVLPLREFEDWLNRRESARLAESEGQ